MNPRNVKATAKSLSKVAKARDCSALVLSVIEAESALDALKALNISVDRKTVIKVVPDKFGREKKVSTTKLIAIGSDHTGFAAKSNLNIRLENLGYKVIDVGTSSEDITTFLRSNIPIVLFSRYIAGVDIDYVGINNILGAVIAVEHLIKMGHKRIAFIGGPIYSSARKDRIHGFCSAHYRNSLNIDEELLICSEVTREGGYKTIMDVDSINATPYEGDNNVNTGTTPNHTANQYDGLLIKRGLKSMHNTEASNIQLRRSPIKKQETNARR